MARVDCQSLPCRSCLSLALLRTHLTFCFFSLSPSLSPSCVPAVATPRVLHLSPRLSLSFYFSLSLSLVYCCGCWCCRCCCCPRVRWGVTGISYPGSFISKKEGKRERKILECECPTAVEREVREQHATRRTAAVKTIWDLFHRRAYVFLNFQGFVCSRFFVFVFQDSPVLPFFSPNG